jgi:cytochrome P450
MTDSVPAFEPYTEAFAANPYPVYAALRERHPVFRSPELGMVLVTRYADVRRVLTDKRLGREPVPRAGAPQPGPAPGELPCWDRWVRVNLLETEGDTHARLRRLLGAALAPRRIEALAPRIEQVAAQLIGRLERGRTLDFVAEIAEPLPVTVIAELFGWPEDEIGRLRPWAAAIVRLYEKDASDEDRRRAEAASREFGERLSALIDERRRRPRDDLVSALAASLGAPDGLTRDELIANSMLLLNAGHEATVNAAGNGLLALLRHPDAVDLLLREPALVPQAIEEMLRYDAPLHLFHRFAREPLEIGGVRVERGEAVGLLYGSANRDPQAFPEPDRFDVRRSPNRHLSFGAATHFCLGAPLARLELRILFSALSRRLASLALTGEPPRYRTGLVFRGLERLVVQA